MSDAGVVKCCLPVRRTVGTSGFGVPSSSVGNLVGRAGEPRSGELGGGGFNSATLFGTAGDAGAGKDAVLVVDSVVTDLGGLGGLGGDAVLVVDAGETGDAGSGSSSRSLRRNSCLSFSAAACSFTASCRLKSSSGMAPSLGSGAVRSFIFGAVRRFVPPTSDAGGDTPPS